MEKLKEIEQCLISQLQTQMSDLKKVNAKELGEVTDAIKDIEEAIYYCSIIEAMDKSKEEKEERPMNISYYMEGGNGKGNDVHHYVPYMEYAPYMMRDDKWRDEHLLKNYNDSRSYYSRRMYMENRKIGDDQKSMKELEHYMKDLADDITEMIEKSTLEEKQVLSNKLSQLAQKVMR